MSVTTKACSSVKNVETRHHGYDNCKMIFMLLVVLWHTAQLSILEATLSWGSTTNGAGAFTDASISFWDRASNHQLQHHSAWTPFISHVVTRYWLWTEKLAVPGFSFLSGYFGKSFLHHSPVNKQLLEDPVIQLESIHRFQRKERVRWEKTISTLLLGPLLWQIVAWLLGQIVTGLHSGEWSLAADSKLDLWDNLGSWYLFALLMWRIWTSLLLSRLRQDCHIPVLVSMILALLSSHTNRGGPQDMRMRLFYFFPYYVAGLYFTDGAFHCLVQRVYRLVGVRAESVQLSSDLDRAGRRIGCIGIIITLLACQIVPREHLGWMYNIDNYHLWPHVVFVMQYLLAGVALVSVILVVKTIPFPLFPFSHGNSTLAIYEAHWPVANWLAWANLPYTGISVASTSLVQHCFASLSPIPAVMGIHLVCYLVCVALGSQVVWNVMLRSVCDPQWACKYIFPTTHPGAKEESEPCSSQVHGGDNVKMPSPMDAV
jgi:hypothetical protein